ncbi:MAG: hypothetical protein WKF36_03945 [Candidatus Nitrosocosmicus sp.]
MALDSGEKSHYPAEINNNATLYATDEIETNASNFKGGSNYLVGQPI